MFLIQKTFFYANYTQPYFLGFQVNWNSPSSFFYYTSFLVVHWSFPEQLCRHCTHLSHWKYRRTEMLRQEKSQWCESDTKSCQIHGAVKSESVLQQETWQDKLRRATEHKQQTLVSFVVWTMHQLHRQWFFVFQIRLLVPCCW